MALALFIPSLAFGRDSNWHVGKASGAVWVTKSPTQTVSLTNDAVLQPGDNITTGRNGRVLLIRNEERILIAPNSAIGIPKANANGMDTTITQRAGSILLEVEKKNVPHFEVETPYLAAVVKGTKFRVTVDRRGARVNVTRGKVQVADFKSGQYALVLPGQAARVLARGPGGLSLTGKGQLSPIERGKPRASSVQALAVPKSGLSKRDASAGKLKKLGAARASFAMAPSHSGKNALRIKAPIGEMKVDFHKVTKGLAHGTGNMHAYGASKQESIFSESRNKGIGQVDDTGQSTANGNGGAASAIASSSGGGNGNGNGGANGNAGGNGSAVAAANSNAGGNGKGNAYGKNK